MKSPIRLLLVDDHEIFLDGISTILSTQLDFEIVNKTTHAMEILDWLKSGLEVDLLVTDLNMPEMSGIDLVRKVKEHYPDLSILVLSMHDDRETISEIMMAEAEGYVLKNCQREELFKAVRRIATGSTYYSHEVMTVILEKMKIEQKASEVVQERYLTDREQEILQLIAEEKSSEEIAEELFISIRTVETHRKNMFKKTEAGTLIGLLKYGIRKGLINLN